MRRSSRHPRLVAAACRIYGVTIRLYPAEFRHAFGRELALTFRNRVEDIVEAGGVRAGLAFAGHIAWDTLNTWRLLVTTSDAPGDAGSLLGLSEGEAACGCLDGATPDMQLMFVSAGFALALAFVGWMALVHILPKHVC
jgi:hypothetical protein